MKHIKTYLVSLGLVLGLMAPIALISTTYAAKTPDTPQKSACESVGGTFSGGKCSSSPSNGIDIGNLVKVVIQVLSIIVGVIAVIMIIIAGLKYVTSGGDSNSVSSAKNTLLYAIIGLIIAAFAQIIVQFVLNKVTH